MQDRYPVVARFKLRHHHTAPVALTAPQCHCIVLRGNPQHVANMLQNLPWTRIWDDASCGIEQRAEIRPKREKCAPLLVQYDSTVWIPGVPHFARDQSCQTGYVCGKGARSSQATEAQGTSHQQRDCTSGAAHAFCSIQRTRGSERTGPPLQLRRQKLCVAASHTLLCVGRRMLPHPKL
jgi:hypothetical protein